VIPDDHVELIADTTRRPLASCTTISHCFDARDHLIRFAAKFTSVKRERDESRVSSRRERISHGSESRVRQRATGECRVAFTMESSKEGRNSAGVLPRFASATPRDQECANGTIKWPTSRDSGPASALVSNCASRSQ